MSITLLSFQHYLINVMAYCIVKIVKTIDGKELPVIMLDSQDEVWEFEVHEEAEHIANILEKNSDSGYTYTVKKV